MTQEQKIIRVKVGLLELAKQLGNVSQAERTHALAVAPQDLQQIAAPAAKDEEVTAERVLRHPLLHRRGEAVKTLSHIRAANRQPHSRARWQTDHRSSTLMTRARAPAWTLSSTITRRPLLSTISIRPGAVAGGGNAAGSDAITTGANSTFASLDQPTVPRRLAPREELAGMLALRDRAHARNVPEAPARHRGGQGAR
jgi:hypothetical protein